MSSEKKSGRSLSASEQMTPHIQEVLLALRVQGSQEVTVKDVRRWGKKLFTDPALMETVVLELVESRRDQIGSPVVKPYASVTVADINRVAREANMQERDLKALQRDRVKKAHTHLKELGVVKDDLEEALIGDTASDMGRRAIHALSFIFNEPIGMENFLQRIGRQVNEARRRVHEDSGIALGELVGQTINFTEARHVVHNKIETVGYTDRELAVHILEEERLGRLRALSRMALLPTVEVIKLSGYEENSEV